MVKKIWRYWIILAKKVKTRNKNEEYFFRVISNQVRFGYGYRTIEGKRQYFAWHGYPNGNSDYFTTSEISESEFDEIRYYIEAVKRDKFDKKEDMKQMFLSFLSRYKCKNVVLGCTEFPVLIDQLWGGRGKGCNYRFYDPCQSAIDYLRRSIE